eukprot:CAMPEP_0184495370 /NCGR_PEP_ID=MMETSP0113_2-20130426/31098_1 /TAXON_ID=91329 /ORGANISM="Norrisiella sphaerica, Strain BC52" /LENGTH=202 /DNA_ID=CAMNT_0026881527 /DNA_START=72 /DNA_END=680 /DNA_ORIENTATION=+
MYKTSLEIYRDLVRLVNHIGARTPKGEVLMNTIRSEFRANKHVTDQDRIAELQEDARRALSNYLISDSLTKMRKRKDIEGDVRDGSQPEYEQVKFNVETLDAAVRSAFEVGDHKATTESKKVSSVLDWAGEDEDLVEPSEEKAEEVGPQIDPEALADSVLRFGATYKLRDPNDGVDLAYFVVPENPKGDADAGTIDVEGKDK